MRKKMTFYIVGHHNETIAVLEASDAQWSSWVDYHSWDFMYMQDHPRAADDRIILYSVHKVAKVGQLIIINEDGTFHNNMTWLRNCNKKNPYE